jgi:hypothetical protein
LREGSRVPPAAVPTPPHPDDPPGWWEQRWLLITLVLAAAVPLLWPETPPLTDLPGHIGRYRIQLGIDQSASLARYYGFEWALIGNLGVDLLIEPLARLIGLEPAVKLIVTAIPMMTRRASCWSRANSTDACRRRPSSRCRSPTASRFTSAS